MSKHTPGPWNIGMSANGVIHDDCKGGDFVAIDGKVHGAFAVVVWRMDGDEKSPVCEANARLIAAAPDLLKALEYMTQMYADLVNSGDAGNWDCEKVKEVIAARAAIAKATKCP